jgi:hypothetical protein
MTAIQRFTEAQYLAKFSINYVTLTDICPFMERIAKREPLANLTIETNNKGIQDVIDGKRKDYGFWCGVGKRVYYVAVRKVNINDKNLCAKINDVIIDFGTEIDAHLRYAFLVIPDTIELKDSSPNIARMELSPVPVDESIVFSPASVDSPDASKFLYPEVTAPTPRSDAKMLVNPYGDRL